MVVQSTTVSGEGARCSRGSTPADGSLQATDALPVKKRAKQLESDNEVRNAIMSVKTYDRPWNFKPFSGKQRKICRIPNELRGSAVDLATRLELSRPGRSLVGPEKILAPFEYRFPQEVELLQWEFERARPGLEPGKRRGWSREDDFPPDEVMLAITRMGMLEFTEGPEFEKLLKEIDVALEKAGDWKIQADLLNQLVWQNRNALTQLGEKIEAVNLYLHSPNASAVKCGFLDAVTQHTLLDFKSSNFNYFTCEWRLQVLMYWRLGVLGATEPVDFAQLGRLGVVNSYRGNFHVIDVEDIPASLVERIDHEFLGV